jgi:hypothetical protein
MITYVIYVKTTGSVRRVGRATSLEAIRLGADEEVAEGISDADFAAAWNEFPHYFRLDPASRRIERKRPLALSASTFTIAADCSYASTISTGVSALVSVVVNGLRQSISGSAMLVHDTPGDLMVEVDPDDPNYYTDRRARAWSAMGPGGAHGALIINVEPPAQALPSGGSGGGANG